ncbi:Shikimate kinase [uncultured Gammaproteobacteria bacterium]
MPDRATLCLQRATKTVVLVGLMGAGKSSVGRRLAARLELPFLDADIEIEAAAGCTVEEFFFHFGESAFRDGERRVITRLITEQPVHVLATGGGAFMDTGLRDLFKAKTITVWLRAGLDTLVARTARRATRPLLKQGDPREILAELIERRYPVYTEADLTIDSDDGSVEQTVDRVLAALERSGATVPLPYFNPATTGTEPPP